MKYRIFSIDGAGNALHTNQFVQWFRNDPQMTGNLIPLIGCYKGEVEASFICNAEDFQRVQRSPTTRDSWIARQEAVMRVSACNKMYVELQMMATGVITSLGSMHEVTEAEAKKHQAWSYRPDNGTWFICKDGNPDHSVKREKTWQARAWYLTQAEEAMIIASRGTVKPLKFGQITMIASGGDQKTGPHFHTDLPTV
jgi:hypothetical protein